MLTLYTNVKKVRCQKYLIWLLKSVPICILPSFQKLTTLNTKKYSLTSTKHSISVRGPKIWNEFLTKEEKEIQSHSIFLRKIKTKLLESNKIRKYF